MISLLSLGVMVSTIGVTLGVYLPFFSFPPAIPEPVPVSDSAPAVLSEEPAPTCAEVTHCQPATFGFKGKTLTEEVRERARREAQRLAPVPITKDMKNPNSVRIPLSQAPPIAAEVKIVNGRAMCADNNDKPRKSIKGKEVHIDRQCCLDPDEVPNPRCYYPHLGR